MLKAFFSFSLLACVVNAQAMPINFGVAADYNIFVQQNFSQPGADSQGKIAVGGNANIGQYDVAVNYDPHFSSSGIAFNQGNNSFADVLVVGGDLKTSGWGNIKGNAIVGGTINDATGHSISGVTTKVNPIDFNSAFAYLNQLSESLSAETPNTSVEFKYNNWLQLTPNSVVESDSVLIAAVNGAMLKSATDLSAPFIQSNNTLVINVAGKQIHFDSLNYGARENQTALQLKPNHILYNFFEAENLTFDYGGFYGNILAPKANFIFQSGDLSGQVMVKSFTGNWGAQSNLWNGLFIPPVIPDAIPSAPVSEPSPIYLIWLGGLLIGLRRFLKS